MQELLQTIMKSAVAPHTVKKLHSISGSSLRSKQMINEITQLPNSANRPELLPSPPYQLLLQLLWITSSVTLYLLQLLLYLHLPLGLRTHTASTDVIISNTGNVHSLVLSGNVLSARKNGSLSTPAVAQLRLGSQPHTSQRS